MLADDTEALLVRVPDDDDSFVRSAYLVPIDACYEFVGRLRMLWRGFDGGHDVREFIDEFFEQLKARSQVVASRVSDVDVHRLDVAPEPYSVTPILTARVGIAAVGDEPVHAIALRCQVRIEPLRRPYSDEEAAGLLDLFGPRERWATTQRTFLWQHSTAMVQGFTGATQISLPLECTYDFEVAAAKYLHALRDGAIPLLFLFSGTVFGQGSSGFSVHQVSWDCEDRYEMPVSVWRDLIQLHYPNAGWVRLGHDTIAALAAYKSARGMLDFDDAVTTLLAANTATRGGPMTAGWDRARAIADAVLYEGYLLYPYRANSRKNQSRWQFGVVGPPGAADAGIGEDDTLSAQVLVDGEATRHSRSWCGSCSCSTAVPNATSAAAASNRSTN